MRYVALALLLTLSGAGYAHEGHDHDDEVASYTYDVMHAEEIKAWMDGGKTIVILDARTKEFDDGNRLPGAKFMPYTAPDKDIQAAIPSHDTPVIVYCSNGHCPASKFLADRLLDLGYTKIYKYPEGIADWTKRGYPVDHAG
ncbi:MAG: rhodanese-like domain-containing protein [Parachlamydia sp.]|nr:rhodanese-like domain-containing protein [Parachlamydia sp.]